MIPCCRAVRRIDGHLGRNRRAATGRIERQHPLDRAREAGSVAQGKDRAGPPFLDQVGTAAHRIGDDRRHAAGHRLVDDQPPGLDRRRDDHVGRGIDRRQLALIDEAVENGRDAGRRGGLLQPGLRLARARERDLDPAVPGPSPPPAGGRTAACCRPACRRTAAVPARSGRAATSGARPSLPARKASLSMQCGEKNSRSGRTP